MDQVSFHGHSMYPAICQGDKITIEMFNQPIHLSRLKVGQVVLLKNQDEWVVHRVVRKHEQKVSKGDWALLPDEIDMAWGYVTEVNGGHQNLCQNRFIAWLSSIDFKQQGFVVRKLRKLVTVATVKLLQFI